MTDAIRLVDLTQTDDASFDAHLADCIVLTQDGRILMQQRPLSWRTSPGCLTTFGGYVDPGESVIDALVRELKEELGAEVREDDVLFIGAISEAEFQHRDLVHVHFWFDRHGTITGCYEAEARHYDSVEEALSHPKIMNYARWALNACARRGLIPTSRS